MDGLMNKDIWNPLWIVSELPASNQGTKELGHLTFHFAGSISNFPRMDNSLRLLNCSSNEPQLIRPLPTVHGMDKQIVSDLNILIQEHVTHEKIEQGLTLSSNLFNTHVKNHNLDNAHIVLGKSVDQNVVTWNKLIAGHVKQGNGLKAFNIFAQMLHEEIDPNRVTLICMLKACFSIQAIDLGRWIHVYILINGLEWALFVANTLIDMYAKCGSLEDAQRVFNRSLEQDVVSWNVLISRWPAQEVRLLFYQMQEARIEPDQVTFISMLKACSSMEDLEESWQVHCLAVESGFESDMLVGGTLIDMYAKYGKFDIAHVVFDRVPDQNVVMWSALISGYVQQGLGQEALKLFEQMQKEGIKPNPITFASILKACSSVGCLDKGRYIYSYFIKKGFALDLFVGSSLIHMYVKCESLDDAHAVFDRLPKKNVVAWSALIGGYAQHGNGQEALQLFKRMHAKGIEADEVTFVYILKACSSMAALEQGRRIHALIIQKGLESDCFVGSTLIDMYSKLASLKDAFAVFERLPRRDVVTWSALIAGFGHDGDYPSALHHFKGMQATGLKPDDVTFLCLLTACSRMGLLQEGCSTLKSMMEDHCIPPTCEHYNSLIDLFCHADCLNEAEDLLETIPFGHNVVGWTALLSSCRGHMNLERGRRCFNQVSSQGSSSAYVLLSNMYTHAGMQEDAEHIEQLRRYANGWKKPGKAFIEVDTQVHDFIVGDKVHPQSKEIFSKLNSLSREMKVNGYKPRLDLVLGSLPEETKADVLCGHSEKLAIAFGLIHTPRGATLRIAKNLRMCPDCHVFTKSLSHIEMREIIVTDAYRIHRFQDGACSCDDQY